MFNFNLILFLKTFRGAFSFTFFKYIEIILSGVAMLLLANQIGPSEMGKSISSLLYITYSSYLSIGMNTVIIKNYKRLSNKTDQLSLLTINIQYFFLVSGLNILLAFYIFNKEYYLLVALISIANLFRSFFMAYFRVIDKIWVLNLNNIVLSLSLLLGVVFYVDIWLEYLTIWTYISWGCMILFVFHDLPVFNKILNNVKNLPSRDVFLSHMLDGMKLAVMGVITTIFMTSDRMLINLLNISVDIKGTYQFADNISMAVFMGVSSIIFYYTPSWINQVNKNPKIIVQINQIINWGLLVLIPFLAVMFFGSLYLRKFWYPDYLNLEYYSTIIIGLKMLLLLNGLGSLIFMGLNKEKDYITLMLLPMILIILGSIVLYFINLQILIYIVPLYICGTILISILLQKRQWIKLNIL